MMQSKRLSSLVRGAAVSAVAPMARSTTRRGVTAASKPVIAGKSIAKTSFVPKVQASYSSSRSYSTSVYALPSSLLFLKIVSSPCKYYLASSASRFASHYELGVMKRTIQIVAPPRTTEIQKRQFFPVMVLCNLNRRG